MKKHNLGCAVLAVALLGIFSLGALAGSGRLPGSTYQDLLQWEEVGAFKAFGAEEEEVELLFLVDGQLTEERVAEINSLGLKVKAAVGELVSVCGPLSAFAALRPGSEELSWVGVALEPLPNRISRYHPTDIHQVIEDTRVDKLRDEKKIYGERVNIGVIDYGFTGALANYLEPERVHYCKAGYLIPQSLAFPYLATFDPEEIPEEVRATEGFQHGAACARAIAAIAPKAEYYLFAAPTLLDRAALWELISDNGLELNGKTITLDVISESIESPVPFDMNDGMGLLAQWADSAVQARDILYCYAIGNSAEGEYTDSAFYGATFRDENDNNYHDFSPESVNMQDRDFLDIRVETVAQGTSALLTVALTWDGWPWHGLPPQDLALILYQNGTPKEVDDKDQFTDARDYPVEIIGNYEIDHSSNYQVAVVNQSEGKGGVERSTRLHLYVYVTGGLLSMEHHTANGSIINLGGAREVVAVGGVCLDENGKWVNFPPSSQGPTTDDPSRVKPDLVAPTGYFSPAFSNFFFGTSASAPIVAGVAALLRSAYEDLPTETLKEALCANRPCDDNIYGCGLVDAWAAYQYLENR